MKQKAQESACVTVICIKMKSPSDYLGVGPPWIGTTCLQVKSRGVQTKQVWDQIFFS